MYAEVARVYRQSLKPADSLFNLYLARPAAAVVVTALVRTRITPNQVSFISMGVMLMALGALAGVSGTVGLWLGVVGIELSYVLDCSDGQLARLTGRTSAVGAQLDFLMDELKALCLIAGITARWHLHDDGGTTALWLGLAAFLAVASALTLTKFVRSPEYAEATGTTPLRHGEAAGAARTGRRSALWPVEATARLVGQYPTTLPVFAAVNRMDVFLIAYGAVHLLYAGRTVLVVLIRLGRGAP